MGVRLPGIRSGARSRSLTILASNASCYLESIAKQYDFVERLMTAHTLGTPDSLDKWLVNGVCIRMLATRERAKVMGADSLVVVVGGRRSQ